VRAIAERWNGMKCRRDAGLIPHDQPVARFPEFGGILWAKDGMEEVIGSIPIRSTNQILYS
jgi:hypothetical protein